MDFDRIVANWIIGWGSPSKIYNIVVGVGHFVLPGRFLGRWDGVVVQSRGWIDNDIGRGMKKNRGYVRHSSRRGAEKLALTLYQASAPVSICTDRKCTVHRIRG